MRGLAKNWLSSLMLAGAVFLLPAENAQAVANFVFTTDFTAANPLRDTPAVATPYMDQAGTWDGAGEVTNTTGDRFTLGVTNSGTLASNVDITVTLPAGFRLPNIAGTTVTVTSPTNCQLVGTNINTGTLTATQSGQLVNFNIPNARDNIETNCQYIFEFGVTTRDTATFATPGINTLTYNIEYDDDTGNNNVVTTGQGIQVNAALLGITKTALTAVATNGSTADFRIDLRNTGTGGAFPPIILPNPNNDPTLVDTLGPNFTGVTFVSVNAYNNTTNAVVAVPPYVGAPTVAANALRFGYVPPNTRLEIVVRTTVNIDPTATSCPAMYNQATAYQRTPGASTSNFAYVDYSLPGALQLTHDPLSYCELCGVGDVMLRASNTGGLTIQNVSITEDLLLSGLQYVAGSTSVSTNGGVTYTALPGVNPTIAGSQLTWSLNTIYAGLGLPAAPAQIDSPYDTTPTNPTSVVIRFQVRRPAGNEHTLVTADRHIQASSVYDFVCGGATQTSTSTSDELAIRQPIPQTTKLGRNTDAGQDAGQYGAIVYGHVDDDIIWRVEVNNTGLAPMQDLEIDDSITANFDINWVCGTEAAATNAATVFPIVPGAPPAGCIHAGGTTANLSYLNLQVDDPNFGTPNNDEPTTYTDVPATGLTHVFYVGHIRGDTCINQTNTADIEWGCESNLALLDGGVTVPASTGGVTPATTILSAATMSTNIVPAGLAVDVDITGSNLGQPLGTKGVVTITITNNTGGSVRLWDGNAANWSFEDILPPQYVMDMTYVPTAVMTPAYGNNYLGMVDTITHLNPATIVTPLDYLNNTAPRFRLSSSTSYQKQTNDNAGTLTTYRDLIRNGDVLTIQFGVVLVDATRYDFVADLNDVQESFADSNDPNNNFTVANQFTLHTYSIICPVQQNYFVNANYPANPEDLDVNTSSAIYILTNNAGTPPVPPLDLTVSLSNNGGHDADDYALYVSFGQAMTVQTAPAGCAATSNPPPHPVWNQPAFIPASASVYRCVRGVIAPGATELFTFQVVRNFAAVEDDLTFRADVVGEITLSDGTPLVFPAPVSLANTTPNQQLVNNYTLDGIRARVLGFNLTKRQSTTCTEDPGAAVPGIYPTQTLDSQIRLGEDCDYYIQAGGWFGFDTPGFTLISVQDMLVTDDLPNGQGFINSDDGATSDMDIGATAEIDGLRNITRNPLVLPALTEGDVSWGFNTGTVNALTERDKFFYLNFASRLLNDPVDPLYQPTPPLVDPNVHAGISTNIARASFNANYESGGVTDTFCISDTAGVPAVNCIVPPGYPEEVVRRIDLTITEPNLIVTKEVCNETLYGNGPACTNFVTLPALADDGDTQDMYVYRVTITNEAASGGLARAPAFNVIVTDVLDASDLMMIAPGGAAPFDTDGLDNDGDGDIDGGDVDGEFFSLNDNTADGAGGTPVATFVISHTHSQDLQRIDAGDSVTFYYRIDPDDAVAPQQILSNTVSTIYDSLEGDSGNQHAPQLTNAETTAPNNSGRARIYDAFDDTASIQILPLQTEPKAVVTVANSAYTGSPQNVVVGEEVQYRLHAQIPVANLRNFVIRDELPPGIRCVDAQTINLSSNGGPGIYDDYLAAGFVPGGTFAATSCTSTGANDVVEWNFGNQELTAASGNALFDFYATFTARVENTATTQEACNIRNGGSTGAAAVPAPVACSTNVTLARLTYQNESLATVTHNYASADIVVREPVVTVTKSFAPVANVDADDIYTVTVTATNSGTAPAYNLQILDDLTATNMTYVGNVAAGALPSGVAPDNVDVATLGANQPIFNWDNPASAGYELAVGETISFTFDVRAGQGVNPDVEPHEILDNTIEARWTSLPSINTALPDIDTAAARTLDPIGEEESMRTGQLTGVPADSVAAGLNAAVNDYDTSATASVVVPALTITKTDLNPAAVPAIGEQKQFQLVIGLPEGVTNNVVITDNLDALAAGGESYVLENAAPLVVYSCAGLEQINATAIDCTTATSADIAAAMTAVPADGASNTITWTVGTVDTLGEDDFTTTAVTPRITITYYARIDNNAATDAGDQLQNGAALDYTNGETTAPATTLTDNTAAITVLEPQLTVTKTWSNVTSGTAATDAGDVLEYEVTITNAGNATAFDINIRDVIPASIDIAAAACGGADALAIINAAVGVTCDTGVTNVAGFVDTPTHALATDPLIWGRANADESLDLDAGDTLTLLYRVTVQDTVQANQTITNSVAVDWTSLDGANGLERTGAGNASCPDAAGAVQAYNDYCAVPAAPATATVVNTNAATKLHGEDGFTPPVNDGNLRIGDTVQYTITLTLQEGTTNNIVLVDTLPAGMAFVGVDAADPVFPAPVYNAGANTLTWTIGNYTNTGDNTANDSFTLTYTAQVVNGVLAHVASTPLNNSLVLSYDTATVATTRPAVSSTVTALQPIIALTDISKVRINGTPSGTSLTAADTVMDFRLTACNSGAAPAYDVVIDDDLDNPWLAPASIRNPSSTFAEPDVYVNGVLQPKNSSTYTYTQVGNNMHLVFHNVAVNPSGSAPNNCIVIEYYIDVDPLVFQETVPGTLDNPNQSWDNNFQVTNYYSLPVADVNAAERETYGPVGPVIFNMNNLGTLSAFTMSKTLIAPATHEATIGDTVTYEIRIPANGTTYSFDQYDVVITDVLDNSLEFVSAALAGCNGGIACNILPPQGVGTNPLQLVIDQIEPGEQAVVTVVARVANNTDANAGVIFGNTASYTFAATDNGSSIIGATASANPLDNITIVEPLLTLQPKTVANLTSPGNPPDAGDILQYTLTITSASGANNSDAFDVSIIDTLSAGLAYNGNPVLTYVNTNAGNGTYANTLGAPDISGQVLTWSLGSATPSNIDIAEGDGFTLTYEVVVQDTVLANQSLSNSAVIQWTSQDGVAVPRVERDGSGGVDDYFDGPETVTLTTPNNNTVSKQRASDTFNAVDDNVRIGDIITYQINLELQEGTHNNLVVSDTLPQGVEFIGIVSINGDTMADYSPAAPFSYADVPAGNVVWSGDPAVGATSLSINLGNVVNAGVGDNNPANNTLIIQYQVQVLNNDVHAQVNNIGLTNSVNYSYATATIPSTTAPDTYLVNLLQPNLSITKTSTQEFGNTEVVAGEDVTYTVTMTNNGTAPAYDVVLQDALPFGMRVGQILSSNLPVTPVYDADYANNGIVRWDFDTGVADAYTILPGASLQLIYTVEVDSTVGAAVTLTNSALVELYYSFDDEAVPAGAVAAEREVYGPTAPVTTTLTTPSPSGLLKENPANTNASIGMPFTYRITVPETPVATALYDVRILDNLAALAPNVDLIFVDVQKPAIPENAATTWIPVNTGTDDNLVIEDIANGGIDIPAGRQFVIDITVQLRNTVNNNYGDVFANTASYTFNSVNDNPASQGVGGTAVTANMTVVEPYAMVLTKTAPVNVQYGVPALYSIDVQNAGTGPAYDLTITDHLPDPVTGGGMCDTAPDTFTAEIRDAANVVQQTLVYNTDFTSNLVTGTSLVTTTGTIPTCTLTITTTSALAVMEAGWHLVVNYAAHLDNDNLNGSTLTNYAAATQWFSADTPAGVRVEEIREYPLATDPNAGFDVIAPGTDTVVDDEDRADTVVQAPELVIVKTVTNLSTGYYAITAKPDDTLHYDISITNTGAVAATNFSLHDDLGALNPTPGYFLPGSFSNVTVTEPDGVNTLVFDANGGTDSNGLVDVSDLDLNAGETLTVSFDATLIHIIESGNVVRNQAQVTLAGFSTLLSDDPAIDGDENPTSTRIGSTPRFLIEKTSADVVGDANVLERADILQYTITVKNIGEEDASLTLLHDQAPANTTYVPNTTALNGVFVPDPATGISPLQDGMVIQPPGAAAGFMLANPNPAYTDNVATITFSVRVNDDVVNGTVISNQAFVSGEGAGSGGFPEQLSDDPRTTEIIGDPTRDIVGNVAILDVQKTVTQISDGNANEQLDPGETLRYTISIHNNGLVPATGVVLTDDVSTGLDVTNITYVPDSLLLNGTAVGTPGATTLPLVAGINVSSSDLPAPVDLATAVISAGESAVIVFEATVNGGVADGTVISNQAEVISNEYPDELTDADGNDINGDQPTVIVTGAGKRLSITKDVFVVGGGRAQPGATLEYLITITNSGNNSIDLRDCLLGTIAVPPNPASPCDPFEENTAIDVLKVVDDITQTGLLTYVSGSARLNGVVNPFVSYSDPRLTVNFDDYVRSLSDFYLFRPGDSFTVRYQAVIDSNTTPGIDIQGTNIVNTAAVDWGTASLTPITAPVVCSGGGQNVDACAVSTLAVGGAPGVATLSGRAWHDSNYDLIDDALERALAGWEVQIYFGNGSVNPGDYLDSVLTDVNGNFTISGLIPNVGDTKLYALKFLAPGAATDTASLGDADSIFVDGPQEITLFDVNNNAHVPNMNLPIHPDGVVYNSVTRQGVAGARLELFNAANMIVPASCFHDPVQANQRTVADGYYKFELNFSGGDCPSPGDYTVRIYPPTGYMDYDSNPLTDEVSRIIPPLTGAADPTGYNVQTCTGDAIAATPNCEVQASEFAPPTTQAPRTAATDYHLKQTLRNFPTDDQLYNNHIPVDPELNSALGISKTSALVNVTRSQLVPYVITVSNALGAPIYDVDIVDDYPAGFKYVAGSARIYLNGQPACDPANVSNYCAVNGRASEEPDSLIAGEQGRTLTWPNFTVFENDVITIKLLLVVGAGVGEGEYVNLAHAENNRTTGNASPDASATVRVVPDPTFDCSDIIGKVFNDRDLNGHADENEEGIAGARVVTAQGMQATTDEYGRYHFTCAVIPNQDRGSNFIVKLDERSLPTGYRVTSENPRTQRATRGKMLKYNFGAAIHHVVRLDMMDAVFKPGSTEIRLQWKPRLDMLITELAKEASILRLSYLAENEDQALVNARLDAVKAILEKRWTDLNCCYRLSIETEVYWRKGGPVSREPLP